MAETAVLILGGFMCLATLIGFIRSISRKPPAQPGSRTDTGGLPPGVVN
jgi:hypothetical protein